jgi:hypothetical protein
VVYEALAFRRWVPQSRMEMDSVMDPRIPKNVSSEKEPCDSQEKKKKVIVLYRGLHCNT